MNLIGIKLIRCSTQISKIPFLANSQSKLYLKFLLCACGNDELTDGKYTSYRSSVCKLWGIHTQFFWSIARLLINTEFLQVDVQRGPAGCAG